MDLAPTPPPPGSLRPSPCPTALGLIVRLPPYPPTQKAMLLPYPTLHTNEVQSVGLTLKVCKGSQQGGTIKGNISAATLNRFRPRVNPHGCGSPQAGAGAVGPAHCGPAGAWPIQDIISLVCVCARINPPFITPARSHYPHYSNTIARRLRHI